jgi:TolB protein
MRRVLFAASALSSIAVAQVFVGAGPSAATFPGDNGGRIAFVSDSPGNFDIFTMSPGGTLKRNLTNSPRIDSGPRWSPDGGKIVFRSDRDGQREIYLMNHDGSSPTRLTNHPAADNFPDWSPDGSKVVFSSDRDATPPCDPSTTVLPAYHLFVMDADGTDVTPLTSDPAFIDLQAHISPDGLRVVFSRVRGCFPDDQRAIHVMNLDGSGLQQLTPWEMQAVEPDWSPSGQQIAFNDNVCPICFQLANLWIMNADGTQQKQLTADSGDNVRPTFSPDGTRLTFTKDPPPGGEFGPEDIYVMNLDGTGVKNLTNTPAVDDFGSVWRPKTG